jgi:microcystin-dependent protein
MAEPFLSEIRLMSFTHAPKGWALCNGQILPINQNQALFSLLGTTFGGNGQTTFALPDLRGRVPIHVGGGYVVGQQGGEQAHTLTQSELPQHTHVLQASNNGGTIGNATGNLFARTLQNTYAAPSNLIATSPSKVASVGGSQAHQNMQPYLCLNFCIALIGIFPSPS